MDTSVSGRVSTGGSRSSLSGGRKVALAVACVVAGFLPLVAGYIPGGVARFIYVSVVAIVMLALALMARRTSAWRRYWEIPLAFFGLALFILADNYVPDFLRANVLHIGTTPGNPIASTIPGTIVVQLDELLLTVLAVVVVLWISRSSLSSIYVRRGRFGRAYVIGIVGFLAFYVLTFRLLQHSSFLPVHGAMDLSRYLRLTPALLLVAGTNAFLEELLFRGLLMSKLNIAFGPLLATFLQAVVFASWHVGITYTPFVLIFIAVDVFPLGLFAGYLTRSSGSIVPSWLFHAGADLAIYLGFLSYIS
jgi:membrane protease YdiL (CAAX protease family)